MELIEIVKVFGIYWI